LRGDHPRVGQSDDGTGDCTCYFFCGFLRLPSKLLKTLLCVLHAGLQATRTVLEPAPDCVNQTGLWGGLLRRGWRRN
jgi:hypothetical protein